MPFICPHGEYGGNWNGRGRAAPTGWRAGGWITTAGISPLALWPATADLKLIGVDCDEVLVLPAGELERRVRVGPHRGLLLDGRPLGPGHFFVAWRPGTGNSVRTG